MLGHIRHRRPGLEAIANDLADVVHAADRHPFEGREQGKHGVRARLPDEDTPGLKGRLPRRLLPDLTGDASEAVDLHAISPNEAGRKAEEKRVRLAVPQEWLVLHARSDEVPPCSPSAPVHGPESRLVLLQRTRQRQLDRDRDRAAELAALRDAERQEVEDGLGRQQAAIRGLEADIERLKREEAERQRLLAEQARRRLEAARRAAAEAAAARPEPDIGGSGGGSADADDGSSGGGNADAGDGADEGGDGIDPPPPTDGSLGARAVSAAMRWLGTPYSWGGGDASGPTFGSCGPAGCQGLTTRGFDCSGLTLYAYAQVGISLGHYTGSQWTAGTSVGYDDLIPGDLVFFGADLGHMGMYIGGGQMIHAPHTGDVVKISDISSGYYRSGFRGGVRPY